jgi:ABC-2 type transport system permease protein
MKGIGQFFIGFWIVIYSWGKLNLAFSVLILGEMIIAIMTASLFMAALLNLAASLCFWLVKSGSILVLAFKMKEYAKYPVTIFNPVFRFIFSFIIPIAFMAYYPCMPFIRPGHVPVLTFVTIPFGILFFYISYKVWMKGACDYAGTGS